MGLNWGGNEAKYRQPDPCFRDGYAIELISEAVLSSAVSHKWTRIKDIEE